MASKRTGHGLPDSVRRHEQALLVLRASLEELQVPLVQLAPQRAGIREERDEGRTTALALSLDYLRAEQQPHLCVVGGHSTHQLRFGCTFSAKLCNCSSSSSVRCDKSGRESLEIGLPSGPLCSLATVAKQILGQEDGGSDVAVTGEAKQVPAD
jgi:hypothetical protein